MNHEPFQRLALTRHLETLPRVGDFLLWLFLLSPVLLYPWLGGGRGAIDILFAFNLLTSLLWVVLARSLTTRPAALHLSLAPLYITTAVDLFLLFVFRARRSSGFITIALTDYSEAREFLVAYAKPACTAVLTLVLVYLPGLYVVRPFRKKRSPRVAAFAAALLLAAYAAPFAQSVRNGVASDRAALDIIGKEMSAPVGAVFQAALALHLHADTSELRASRERHSFGATKKPSAQGETFVYVIGESSRPQNWSLFGYSRSTTPRLDSTTGLVPLPNMLTTAPHTAYAVPSMLSLQPITQWASVVADKSIVAAFNEAGFKTFWLSTQEADAWGGIIPQVASEAKRRSYFDRSYDGAMLDTFRAILDGAPGNAKLFIVLHTKGSHFNFARRYPPEFTRFSTPGGTRSENLVDTYDNSILYTDWFLSEIISSLSQHEAFSALFYASDHGENLLDDENGFFGHALGTRYDLAAAAFLWLSDSLQRDRPALVEAAQRNAPTNLSLSNIPHSILELAGIRAKGLDPTMSIFSPNFANRVRSYVVRGDLRQESAPTGRMP